MPPIRLHKGATAMRSFLHVVRRMSSVRCRAFDRVRVRATLRLLASVGGMGCFMDRIGVKLKDFGSWVNHVTGQIKAVRQRQMDRTSPPIGRNRAPTSHAQSPRHDPESSAYPPLHDQPPRPNQNHPQPNSSGTKIFSRHEKSAR
jgi:hypothetical protein